jgi:hypothetical protein
VLKIVKKQGKIAEASCLGLGNRVQMYKTHSVLAKLAEKVTPPAPLEEGRREEYLFIK